MGAKIPRQVAESELSCRLTQAGLERIYQGKVRDTYKLPERPDLLLVVATDRLSIFDFVLGCLVKDKGEILTALTILWLTRVLENSKHHLAAYGTGIDHYLPASLQEQKELQTRALIVKKLNIVPVECVARGYLTGSAWSAYQKNKAICGQLLPGGLHDGTKLACPIFTPTTKSESGHDKDINIYSVLRKYGIELENLTLKTYKKIFEHCFGRGIILADTKFEFGTEIGEEGGKNFILADEVGTPDSSRFWDIKKWKEAAIEKKSPAGYDKQPVRDWGKIIKTPFLDSGGEDKQIIGINNLDPENKDHIEFVHELKVPEEIISNTTLRYRRILFRLADRDLENFQKTIMGI